MLDQAGLVLGLAGQALLGGLLGIPFRADLAAASVKAIEVDQVAGAAERGQHQHDEAQQGQRRQLHASLLEAAAWARIGRGSCAGTGTAVGQR